MEPFIGVRLRVAQVVGVLAFALLVARLWSLQIARWSDLEREAAAVRTSSVRTRALRGVILDRRGRALGVNKPTYSVVLADPALTEEQKQELIVQLADVLHTDEQGLAELKQAVQAAPGAGGVELCDGLTLDQVALLLDRRQPLPGIEVAEHDIRYYPEGATAAHVLGYVGQMSEDDFDDLGRYFYCSKAGLVLELDERERPSEDIVGDWIYFLDSTIGRSGIEKTADFSRDYGPILQGLRGTRVFEVDREGRPRATVRHTPPRPGAEVVLCLDLSLQRRVEALLDRVAGESKRSAAAVVLGAQTGEVFALASAPDFDPNMFVREQTPEQMAAFYSDPSKPELNRAIGGTYPPGSAFKIVSAVAALETGKVRPKTTFECPGIIHVGAGHHPYRCWQRAGHARVSFRMAIEQSCDVYFYEIARKGGLGIGDLAKWAHELGFGQQTGIDLPGESVGLVPTREWHAEYWDQRWALGNMLNTIIGQGDLKATPLQLAVATAAIANGGKVLRPHLIKRLQWPESDRAPVDVGPEVVRTLDASAATLRLVREGMRSAVHGEHGTGKAADLAAVSVAGKTGSAERDKVHPTHAWFTCFAPYEKPQYVVTVFCEEAGHGGSVAAPVARQILAHLFGTTPSGGTQVAHVAGD